jgi:hypothetical protein
MLGRTLKENEGRKEIYPGRKSLGKNHSLKSDKPREPWRRLQLHRLTEGSIAGRTKACEGACNQDHPAIGMRDYRAPIPNALERRAEKERGCDVHNFIDRKAVESRKS